MNRATKKMLALLTIGGGLAYMYTKGGSGQVYNRTGQLLGTLKKVERVAGNYRISYSRGGKTYYIDTNKFVAGLDSNSLIGWTDKFPDSKVAILGLTVQEVFKKYKL